MKKLRLIALAIAFIGSGTMVLYFAPSLLMHLLIRSKVEVIHGSEDIQNALLVLKQQKAQIFAPHLAFKIPRQPHVAWNWFANWKGAGVGRSWTQADRIIEFSKVGDDLLVYSIPIRWQEDESAGQEVSEMETNMPVSMAGNEEYSRNRSTNGSELS
jgi:hypothetical protein